MDFEKFKRMFDESFGKVTPDEFIADMESLGYKFKSIPLADKLHESVGVNFQIEQRICRRKI